ncbi:glycoside hydrolase family 88 protein [Conexibacter sp. S30A1]|uniref:glycoside hydrolase family 88 protein n=1 Tax=Conexibacter sp. S30A1 TaxID=2937800 RepID=UPI00200C3109|nr:glycoside hydrolase family 88 protein [Conexibacter sp. S30A1]
MTEAAPAASLETLYRALAQRTLRWRFGQWYWGDAIAVDGLITAERHGLVDLSDTLADIERWARSAPVSFDDALAPFRALSQLARTERIEPVAIERAALALERLPRTPEGIPLLRPHVPEWRHLVWVDSLYHLPVGLAMLPPRPARERENDALAVALETIHVLDLPLGIAHCYESGRMLSNRIAWTRGIGWALLGALDLIAELGSARTAPLLDVTKRWIRQLAEHQREDGHWRTVLGDASAEPESSTAAFFVAAALHECTPAETVDSATLQRAIDAVVGSIDRHGVFVGVSADTHAAWCIDNYRNPPLRPSPWGQGAALRALDAVVRRRGWDGLDEPAHLK